MPSRAESNRARLPLRISPHDGRERDRETHLITRLEGDNAMSRIIEFHIPADFRPRVKCLAQERGGLVVFPSNLKKPACDRSVLHRERSQNEHTINGSCCHHGRPSAIDTVYADRGGLNRHQNPTDSSGRGMLVCTRFEKEAVGFSGSRSAATHSSICSGRSC